MPGRPWTRPHWPTDSPSRHTTRWMRTKAPSPASDQRFRVASGRRAAGRDRLRGLGPQRGSGARPTPTRRSGTRTPRSRSVAARSRRGDRRPATGPGAGASARRLTHKRERRALAREKPGISSPTRPVIVTYHSLGTDKAQTRLRTEGSAWQVGPVGSEPQRLEAAPRRQSAGQGVRWNARRRRATRYRWSGFEAERGVWGQFGHIHLGLLQPAGIVPVHRLPAGELVEHPHA
jgi:hypothetical protein